MKFSCPRRRLIALLLALLFGTAYCKSGSKAKDAVKLESVKALTFHSGKLTTSRRVDPIPQLQCVGGSAQGLFEPETVRCQNSGSSYSAGDIEWTCQASLPPEFRLGGTEVVCEGYDNSNDEYILKGSCGLEYRLVLTEMGKEKFGKSWFRAADRASNQSGDFSPVIFWAVFIGVACWIVYAAFCRDTPGNRLRGAQGPRLGFGGGGGGGPGGDDDPPPPYDPRPPPNPRKPAPSSSTYSNWNAPNRGQDGAWRPGFWTGLGTGMTAGAAARHFFGGGRDRYDTNRPPRRTGGLFGGGSAFDPDEGSSTGRRRPYGGSPAGGWGMGSSSQPYSSERYTSTGFGGTRRR